MKRRLPTTYQGVKFRSVGDPVLYLSNPPGVSPASRRRMLHDLARLDAINHRDVGDPEILTRIAQYQAGSGGASSLRVIPRDDLRSHRKQRARRGQAVLTQANNGITASGEQVWGKRGHLIFRVARPTNARIIDMIQNRMTMVGSAQPFFSKWWCKGAMRKTRVPVRLYQYTCTITEIVSTTNKPPTMQSTMKTALRTGYSQPSERK